MVENLRHIGVVVSNIEKFKNIFIKYLGLTNFTDFRDIDPRYISKLVGRDVKKIKICVFNLKNGDKIELLEYDGSEGIKRPPFMTGSSHIALTVKNIDDLFLKSKDFDVDFFSPPIKNPEQTVKLSYVCIGKEVNLELVELLSDK